MGGFFMGGFRLLMRPGDTTCSATWQSERDTMNRKILVMGLPGSGKTSITRSLAPMLNAVVFNNDEVRANINRDLGFTMEDRVEQARRMGWLCDRVVESGGVAI